MTWHFQVLRAPHVGVDAPVDCLFHTMSVLCTLRKGSEFVATFMKEKHQLILVPGEQCIEQSGGLLKLLGFLEQFRGCSGNVFLGAEIPSRLLTPALSQRRSSPPIQGTASWVSISLLFRLMRSTSRMLWQ